MAAGRNSSPSSRHRHEDKLARKRRRRWMMKRTLAAALCSIVVAPALAQIAAPPTKLRPPKTPAGEATVTVMVTNSRKADLVQLQAAEGGSVNWKKVLGAVKSGKQASAILPRPFNCRVNLHGTFSDGQSMDASDVDVCEQKTLNLTD
jgi:hypothetical protein